MKSVAWAMNAWLGWGLAAVAAAMGWLQDGWRGVALAASVTVFWLLLQFSRAMRVMRQAGQRPVGSADSVVMLSARLRPGMTLLQIVALTRSLGQRVSRSDAKEVEDWRWTDAGGRVLTAEMQRGRLRRWTQERPDQTVAAKSSAFADDGEAVAERVR